MKRKKFLQALAGVMAAVVMVTNVATPMTVEAQGTAARSSGISGISDKWFFEDGGWNNNYAPNAIDPTLFYGADDKLYMVYGSWSGGLFILEIDKETGAVIYPGVDSVDKASGNFTDRYFGTHIAGANHQSGEGPFIDYDKETGYYWLYETYGGLTSTGGYNMRLFRSKNVYGPYVDAAGNNAANSGVDNDKYGVKLIGNYQFLNQPGYRAAGHNSALIDDDGSRYLVFHQRFDKAEPAERHEVRVHQQFLNEDQWPVTAVYENRGEKIGHYENDKVVGSYEIINHGTDSKGSMIQSQIITLNEDGTVSGELTGTWEKKTGTAYDYVTIKIGTATYKGVFFEQQDETAAKNKVMTFTAIGDNNESLWGSALPLTDEVKTQLAAAVLDDQMPSDANADITLATELKGATISWASNKTDVVANDGKVTRPDEDTEVTLTATIQSHDETLTREYKVKIASKAKLICGYDFEVASVSGDAISAVGGSLNTSPAALKGTATIVNDPVRGQVLKIVSDGAVEYNQNYLALPEDTLANVKTKGYTVAMWVNCDADIFEHSALFNAMRNGTYPMTRIGVNLCGRINANGYIDGGYHNTILRGTGWHHVAYSIDATGLKTWVDGNLFEQIDKDLSSCFDESNDWSIHKATDVRVGSGSPWVDRDIENAMFDNVEIYDTALIQSEIKALYESTKKLATSETEQPSEIPEGSETNQQPVETPAESQTGQTTEETVEASTQDLVTETAVVAASNGEEAATLETPKRVSVHDPSIVKSDDDTYYVFGSHLANAKSKDLINWEQMTGDYGSYDWKTKSIYGDIINNLAESFKWAGYDDGDCAGEKLAVWAPDVIWNADYKWEDGTKGAWMIYYSASSTWRRSCIGYAVSKNIEGTYKYVDTVIYSGFTKTGATDGNSTRNTKWDNDYLNLNELIEIYKKAHPIYQPSGGSSSSSDSQATTDVKKPETPEKTEETPAEVGTEVTAEEGSFEVVESKTDEPAVAFTAPASTKEKKVEIPDVVTVDGKEYKVTKIADGAYKKNSKITTVTIGENVTEIGKNAFSGCTNLKTVKINANVEKIGNGAFNGCKKMEKVSIPKNVQEIGAKAFNGCKNLKTITIKSTALKKVDATAFKGIKANATIKVPKKQYKAYKKMLKKVLPSTVRIVKY